MKLYVNDSEMIQIEDLYSPIEFLTNTGEHISISMNNDNGTFNINYSQSIGKLPDQRYTTINGCIERIF